MGAYEFVCDHLIPGCTTRVEGEEKDEVAARAEEHMRTHHQAEWASERMNAEMWQAIVRLRS